MRLNQLEKNCHKNSPEPGGSIIRFNRTFKELSPSPQKEAILLNTFYEASITLKPIIDKIITKINKQKRKKTTKYSW